LFGVVTPRVVSWRPQMQTADCYVILAALSGFFVVGPVVGAITHVLHLDTSYVMAGGMIALMLFLLIVNFVPTRCRHRLFPEFKDGDISPIFVFLVCGCLGSILGGLFGGVFHNVMEMHDS
jgi:hypothetical protein